MNSKPSTAAPNREAVRELIRRKRCRDSLHSFALNIDIPTAPRGALEPDEDVMGPAEWLMPKHHARILTACQRAITTPFGRALIMAPPGSAKSTYVDVVAAPWAIGRDPGTRVILTSYASTLAYRQSRRAKQVANSQLYKNLVASWHPKREPFEIIKDSDPEWTTNYGSELLAAGLTAGITGNRANGGIIDDPVAGREEADSPAMRKKILDAYQDDLLTRLLPGAWLILIMCQTGDTAVTMADGTKKRLRDIVPGDRIRTYSSGQLTETTVLRWANQGPDDVFEIRTASGATTKANARHPFLVERHGERIWLRTSQLQPGDYAVRIAAVRPLAAREGADHTTISGDGRAGSVRPATSTKPLNAQLGSNIDTAFRRTTMRAWSTIKIASARFANKSRRIATLARIGAANFVLTTTTPLAQFGACSATIATSALVTERPQQFSPPLLNTCDFALDEIISVVPAGREEVFDLQVAGTENFIADGFVSHNTRWNEQDLAGEILPLDYKGQSGLIECRDGLVWDVVNLPAKAEHADDPLGRKPGEYIWPEYYPERHWKVFENGVGPTRQRTWSSLYQQRPAPQGSGSLNREMFNWYEGHQLPQNLRKVMTSDWAVTAGKNDFTEHAMWGLDVDDNLWALDWWYEQSDSGRGIVAWLDMVVRHQCRLAFNEGGVIDKAIRPAINAAIRDWNASEKHILKALVDLRSIPSMQDKMAKLQSFIARAAIGKVWLPKNAPWAERLVTQLLSMPAGRHDDAADNAGLIGRALDQYSPPHHSREERKEGLKPFTAAWLEYQEPTKPKVRYK